MGHGTSVTRFEKTITIIVNVVVTSEVPFSLQKGLGHGDGTLDCGKNLNHRIAKHEANHPHRRMRMPAELPKRLRKHTSRLPRKSTSMRLQTTQKQPVALLMQR